MMQFRNEARNSFDDPLVSVIIPTYNRFDSVVRCLDSVKTQSYSNLDILIVDDCSTDFYDWRRLDGARHLTTGRNHGGAASARNVGLAASRGEYICFLDDDDGWHRDKVRRQIDDLKRNNFHFSATEGLMVVNRQQLDENPIYHREYYKTFMIQNHGSTTLPRTFDLTFLLRHNYIINSSVMISREVYETVGSLYEGNEHLEQHSRDEDYEYWRRILAANYDCLYLDEPLVYYRAFRN